MKKIFSLIVILMVYTAGVFSETVDYPVKENVELNNFWANWFISVDAGAQVSLHAETTDDKNVFNTLTPSASVSLGKWFTPSIGLRTQVNAGHYSPVSYTEGESYLGGSLYEDVMFNVSNMFFGYRDDRVWNLVPYVGFGRAAVDKNWGEWSWNAGLDNQFRVGKHVLIDLELYVRQFNVSVDEGRNWNAGAQAGVVFELGRNTWTYAADVATIELLHAAQIDALNDALARCYEERNGAVAEAANTPKTVEVVKTVTMAKPVSYSLFFASDSYALASKKDCVNLTDYVDYVDQTGGTLTVTGYADSKTGSTKYNDELSLRRAEAVRDLLVKAGVPEDKINVVSGGGVSDLEPYYFNRRAVVKAD